MDKKEKLQYTSIIGSFVVIVIMLMNVLLCFTFLFSLILNIDIVLTRYEETVIFVSTLGNTLISFVLIFDESEEVSK